jgi:Glycosyltransferase family 87
MLVTTLRRPGVICLLSVLCAAGIAYYHLGLFVPRAIEVRTAQGFGGGHSFGADFYPIWLTSRRGMLLREDPYSPEMTRRIQIGLFGRTLDFGSAAPVPSALRDYRAFAYPAFVDVLFWPLALLPFFVVRIALAVILAAATALSIVLWLRAFRLRIGRVALVSLTLLTLSSYAVLEGLFAEQFGLLVGFLLAALLAALVDGRLFFSGSLLALTLIKPQMTALVIAYLLLWSLAEWRVRWRFVGGFVFMAALLGISSLLVWPHWIGEWLRVVVGYRQYSTPRLAVYLLGNELGPRLGPVLIAALVVSAIVLAWRMRRAAPKSGEFPLTISLMLALTTITLLPGHAVYDHVVLLPGIILIALSWRAFAASSRVFRVVLRVTALVLFWQWMLAPVVIALRPILSQQLFFSTVITLPIRTAASIPFGVLVLLGLMLRHVAQKGLISGSIRGLIREDQKQISL